jgi:hypothetical protein
MVEEDHNAIRQELQRSLAAPITTTQLSFEIATLLRSFRGKIDARVAAQRLAEHLVSPLTYKSQALQTLIKYRPRELANLANEAANLAQRAAWEDVKEKVLPLIAAQKKLRRKFNTREERVRRTKETKNRYERYERNYVRRPGAIEREFSARSALLWSYPLPITGSCLDEIFHGGKYKMSGTVDSLQWLFGLSRKKLSMARPAIEHGRGIFYDYRGVLACMDALLKQTGPSARWLPDPARREEVLTGVLFRARQEAKPRMLKRFEKTLLPHLS